MCRRRLQGRKSELPYFILPNYPPHRGITQVTGSIKQQNRPASSRGIFHNPKLRSLLLKKAGNFRTLR
jgi:hypothetical protein